MAVSCTVSCIVSTNNANFFGIILKLWGKERVITLDRIEKSLFFSTSIINFVKFFSQSRYMLSYNTNFIFVLYVGTKLLDKKIYNTKELTLIQFHGIAKRINLKPILACPRPSTNANKKPSEKKKKRKKEIAPKREREKKNLRPPIIWSKKRFETHLYLHHPNPSNLEL